MNSSSSNPIISIVMPAKNAALYLDECIQSIIQQTFDRWELIVVNDHSTDLTNEILLQFAKNDGRINVFQNKDHGIIPALKLAYSRASGQYITRMDADDIMTTNKLELLLNALTQKGKGFVAVGGVHYFSADGIGDGYKKYADWLNQLTRSNSNFYEIYKECVIPSPCWMVDRADFESCGGFDSDIYPEDYDLCFRFYKAGFNIAGMDDIIHLWRDYPSRSSRTDEHYADNRFLDLKIKYFIELDYRFNENLILWGAGKKGKLIATKLIEHKIDFTWITNNKNKIGKDIYGQILQPPALQSANKHDQFIIAVANANEQSEIVSTLNASNPIASLFLFC